MLKPDNNLLNVAKFNPSTKWNDLQLIWLFSIFALAQQAIRIISNRAEFEHTFGRFEQC